MSSKTKLRRIGAVAVIVVMLVVIGVIFGKRVVRMGIAADVTKFTPSDVDALLWIPRVDQFAETLFEFTRGVQEASRLRDLLKPETGVELNNPQGIRKAGIDPEAGLVIFSRNGMVYMLFGVENAESVMDALRTKFVNLGFSDVVVREAAGTTPPVGVVQTNSGDVHAAFVANQGLLVLVYRGSGDDPISAALNIHKGPQNQMGFFNSEYFKNISNELGDKGPLLFADASTFARDGSGKPRLQWFERLKLHGAVDTFVRSRLVSWLSRVKYAAARIDVNSCAASIRSTLKSDEGVTLIPNDWLLPKSATAPKLGLLLPRDTVVMARVGINLSTVNTLINKLTLLGTSFSELSDIMGLGSRGTDPVAKFLGSTVHPDLADRHIVKDLLSHLTGHVAVAIAGLDRKAQVADVIRVGPNVSKWLNSVAWIAAFQVNRPEELHQKWWSKRTILQKAGYEVGLVDHSQWKVIQFSKGCKARDKSCEQFGVILKGNVLMVTTGNGTLPRVLAVLDGKASNYLGLTREPVAQSVLKHEPMLSGVYFSFDGLLKALRNRNLPGGATRYLAQFYELAFKLKTAGGDASAELLLTR